MKQKITLDFTPAAIELILVGLSKLPYEQSAVLIEGIKNHAEAQSKAAIEAEEKAKQEEESKPDKSTSTKKDKK